MTLESPRSIDFFEYLLNLDEVKEAKVEKSYQSGEMIAIIGTPITQIGILMEGLLETINYTLDGKEIYSSLFDPPSVILEYLYLRGAKEYTYNLKVISPSEIVWIPSDLFRRIVLDDRQANKLYIFHLVDRGHKNQELICCLSYPTLREKLAYWIYMQEDLAGRGIRESVDSVPSFVDLPYSQEILSHILLVDRSSLNKELNKMQREGYFKLDRNKLTHIDKDKILSLL